MNENEELFNKARFLGIPVDENASTLESLNSIAGQVGIPNYNHAVDYPKLSSTIDGLYNQKKSLGDDKSLKKESPITDEKPSLELNSQSLSSNIQNKQNNSNISQSPKENNAQRLNKNDLVNKNNFQNRRNKSNDKDSEKLRELRNRTSQNITNYRRNVEQEEKKESFAKKKAKEIGLQAIGVPSSMAKNLAQESNVGNEKIHSVNIGVSLKIIGFGMGILMLLVVLVVVLVGLVNEDDISEFNSTREINSYIKGDIKFEEITDILIYLNLCSSDEDCLNSPAGQFLMHMKDVYETYKTDYTDFDGNPILIDTQLILETISYGYNDLSVFDENNLSKLLADVDALALAQVEEYQEVGDYYYEKEIIKYVNGESVSEKYCAGFIENKIVVSDNKKNTYYRISSNKFASYLLYGEVHENYEGKVKIYDVDIHPDSASKCIPEGRKYTPPTDPTDKTETTYTGEDINGYLYDHISFNYSGSETLLDYNKGIIEDIYERVKENSGLYDSIIGSAICSGVMVVGDNAGVYPLEEYVAKVIQRENFWYQGDNIENMKAQAVAARTYVLRRTNNCTTPIENSERAQTMAVNATDMSIKAANETAGQVLLDSNGNYISTEYDAFCLASSDNNNYYIVQRNLAIPKLWAESNNIPRSYLTNLCGTSGDGGHGRGMSQWGSRYLQSQGKKYDEILGFFYGGVASLTSVGNSSTMNIPTNKNDLKNRLWFNFDINAYIGNTLFGQCVWYAKHRALEIIDNVESYDQATKDILIASIKGTNGNGQDWYRNPNGTYFKKSNNINAVKAGSIVSWTRGQYGHVAIVESVRTGSNGETLVTISEGWRTKNSEGKWYVTSDVWSVANVQKKEMTLSKLETYSGKFNGYVYLY